MQEYYKILGVNEESTLEEVTIRFNKLLIEFDPNKQSADLKDFFTTEQEKLNEAYKQISLILTKKEEPEEPEEAKDEDQEVSEDPDIETKICEKCGNKVHNEAVVCMSCGCSLVGSLKNQNQIKRNELSTATAALICGILSILGGLCYGIGGLIMGIVALAVSNKDNELLKADPEGYSDAGNLKAGRICAKIGISLFVIWLLFLIVILANS